MRLLFSPRCGILMVSDNPSTIKLVRHVCVALYSIYNQILMDQSKGPKAKQRQDENKVELVEAATLFVEQTRVKMVNKGAFSPLISLSISFERFLSAFCTSSEAQKAHDLNRRLRDSVRVVQHSFRFREDVSLIFFSET